MAKQDKYVLVNKLHNNILCKMGNKFFRRECTAAGTEGFEVLRFNSLIEAQTEAEEHNEILRARSNLTPAKYIQIMGIYEPVEEASVEWLN